MASPKTDVPPSETSVHAGSRRGAVVLVVLAGVAAASQLGKLPPALPILRAELSVGLVSAGWLVSIINATTALVGLPVGLLADRFGRRRALVFGLLLQGLASLAGSLAASFPVLLAARFLEGVGFVCILVAGGALVAEAARPEVRSKALGLWSCYMPVGIAAAMLAAPFALATADWHVLWIFLGGLSLLLAPIAWRATKGLGAPNPRGLGRADILGLLRLPGSWILAGCFAFYTVQWMAMVAWMPSLLAGSEAAGAGRAATLTALVVLANICGNLSAGWLLQRGMARWLLIALATLAMALCLQGAFIDGLPPAAGYLLALLFSAVGGAIPGAILASAPLVAPRPQLVAGVNGILLQGSNVGTLVGPPLVAVAAAASGGFREAAPLLLLAALAIFILCGILRRLEVSASAAAA